MTRREQIRSNIVRQIASTALVATIAIVFGVFAFVPKSAASQASIAESSSNTESDESPILSGSVQLDDSEEPEVMVSRLELRSLDRQSVSADTIEAFDPSYDSRNFQNLIASGELTPEKLERIITNDDIYIDSDSDLDLDLDPLSYIENYEEEIVVVEENDKYDDIQEWEINLGCQMIQHELGSDEKFFPGYDFDELQQGEAIIIFERRGTHGWKTIADVLLAPNQFISSLDELSGFDPYEPRTRENVMKVLRGEVDSSRLNLRISMSWRYDMDKVEALSRTEDLSGCKIGYHEWFYANYGDFKKLCIFAAEKEQ